MIVVNTICNEVCCRKAEGVDFDGVVGGDRDNRDPGSNSVSCVQPSEG